ncbi:hypothetical protein M0Q28_05780 [Patescibacteria group bacterium]|jgi:hypothetical protein|nr:hypothetical protein [Patescibacteria group bacterium]
MRKLFLTLFLILLAAWAYAENPFNVIGGGGSTTLTTGSVTSAHILDNTIVGGDIADNAVNLRHVKFVADDNSYSVFEQPSGNRIILTHYSADNVALGKLRFYSTGEVYLGGSDNTGASVGYLDFTTTATYLLAEAGRYLSLSGDNVAVASGVPFISDNVQITGGSITGVTGVGTVTGPATATEDYVVTWGADNVSIKDGQIPLSALATLASPTFTGTVTAPKVVVAGTDGGTIDNTVIGGTTASAGTFTTVTADEFVSSAANGTHKGNVANSGAASNLTTAGDYAYNLTTGALTIYDNTIADNVILVRAVKSKSFGWDNAAATDDGIFLGAEWSPVASTLISIKCFASTDNVVGFMSECAADNNASCVRVDDTDWTITNAEAGVTVLAADFENAAIAAGASLKWDTTSVGAASNRFSCTIRYRE